MRPSAVKLRGSSGHFRIRIIHPSGRGLDVTMFRGIPVQVGSISTADPFGDSTASLTFPMISGFDRPGFGDLWWWVPWARVEIRWYDTTDQGYAPSNWVWEGNFVSEEISDVLTIQCKGALFMADNFLAAPFYPQYPVPYEKLISMSLDPKRHPSLSLKPMKIIWPGDWNLVVPPFKDPAYLWFLRPWGVPVGSKWSGLTTRSTGSWEPLMTGFVQTLLSTMYTPEGDQWTLVKASGRVPVLKVRQPLRSPDENTLAIGYGLPGVTLSFSRDFTQSANVIYGSGQDLAGTSFSGAQVAPDGNSTSYDPFAALPQVHPATGSNPRLIPTMTRKESRLTFPSGIDELTARGVAATQIMRFADPGFTGSITLNTDPTRNGDPFNRMLIRAGDTILLTGLRGTEVLFFVSASEVDVNAGTTTLTVDTKFRDALTVAEVRARTRDALNPVHLLQVGKQSVTVQDLLKPWSYTEGSGVIPSGSKLDATPLFKKMEGGTTFPWTGFTAAYPPKKYPQYYIKVSRKGPKASQRWQDNGWNGTRSQAVPIKAAQTAEIMLSQIMAVDANGHPLAIPFHFSVYLNDGVTSTDMPLIPKGGFGGYAASDHYPLFPAAFENTKPTGETQDNPGVLLPQGADLVIGWGSYYDPAGYSPGLKSAGGHLTGMLVDETSWTFDTSGVAGFDTYSVKNNAKNKTAGMLYAMFFQDAVQEAYFIGRLWRKPPGANQ